MTYKKMLIPSILCFLFLGIKSQAQSQIKIGGQTWMTENLDVENFQNGDKIPQAQTDTEWEEAGFNQRPAWCYVSYWEKEENIPVLKFKKLYNSFAVNDPRGIAPAGWRVTTRTDWNNLKETVLNQSDDLSGIASRIDWENGAGSNETGLSIQPGGWRDVGCGGIGSSVTFWCEQEKITDTDELGKTYTYSFIQYGDGQFGLIEGSTSWIMGHYIRCVKIE